MSEVIETFRPERTLSEGEVEVEGHFCKYASTTMQNPHLRSARSNFSEKFQPVQYVGSKHRTVDDISRKHGEDDYHAAF